MLARARGTRQRLRAQQSPPRLRLRYAAHHGSNGGAKGSSNYGSKHHFSTSLCAPRGAKAEGGPTRNGLCVSPSFFVSAPDALSHVGRVLVVFELFFRLEGGVDTKRVVFANRDEFNAPRALQQQGGKIKGFDVPTVWAARRTDR